MKKFLKLLIDFIFSFRGFFKKHDFEEEKIDESVITSRNEPGIPPVQEPLPTPSAVHVPVSTPKPKPKQRYCWCLDNGHGSLQPGKRSPKLPDGRQLLEWEFNRSIVKRIISELDNRGIAYYNVVPETDVDDFLTERVVRANEFRTHLRKIFVSIHANAGPVGLSKWSVARGVETWYEYKDVIGETIANVFQYELIKHTGLRNRKIKTREEKQFYVLTQTQMPAVLTENGFFNNIFEVELLLSDEFRQKVADAHIEAIQKMEDLGVPGYK